MGHLLLLLRKVQLEGDKIGKYFLDVFTNVCCELTNVKLSDSRLLLGKQLIYIQSSSTMSIPRKDVLFQPNHHHKAIVLYVIGQLNEFVRIVKDVPEEAPINTRLMQRNYICISFHQITNVLRSDGIFSSVQIPANIRFAILFSANSNISFATYLPSNSRLSNHFS
jgi:hypothetical protein